MLLHRWQHYYFYIQYTEGSTVLSNPVDRGSTVVPMLVHRWQHYFFQTQYLESSTVLSNPVHRRQHSKVSNPDHRGQHSSFNACTQMAALSLSNPVHGGQHSTFKLGAQRAARDLPILYTDGSTSSKAAMFSQLHLRHPKL